MNDRINFIELAMHAHALTLSNIIYDDGEKKTYSLIGHLSFFYYLCLDTRIVTRYIPIYKYSLGEIRFSGNVVRIKSYLYTACTGCSNDKLYTIIRVIVFDAIEKKKRRKKKTSGVECQTTHE